MERYKCKLCSKAFANGRALGGHMRSHLANLPIPPKTQQKQLIDGTESTESASSLSSSERDSEEKGIVYGLRENPKKSFKVGDPEFLESVVQDRESETESPKNPTRQRRSKRTRTMREPGSTELEPVSSVSDTSPEEDIALCLMMLSRDTWSSSDDVSELRPSQTRKYLCETCGKVFNSFQALGGHRTSHKKKEDLSEPKRRGGTPIGDQKIHECPICYKVFGSGQALGGHKRSHFVAKIGECLVAKKCEKFGESLIDLNFPAPMEEDDFSQPEVSAVSDAEFGNSTIQCGHQS
ncbi:Zinc finger protein [Actinidia chinensis var. chinensis]|uniref:Zinc finger protein n=1 Tax=Actinidia chinensis var. chinensis TaxID=1590841 RepID=A0A2R6QNN1_ACTCC|nr:Zinc finger protein [Actinidia chinensis var. chinensis]